MGSVYGANEKIGMEGLELIGKRQVEVNADADDWAAEGALTYSLMYMSSALLNGSQWAGTRTSSQNESSEVVSAPQTTTFHEMDNSCASRSS